MRTLPVLLAALLLPLSAGAQFQTRPAGKRKAYVSPRRAFSCEVPPGWKAFEEETPWGFSAHFLGPAQAAGAWRAALHVHFIDRRLPGFVPVEETLKRERKADPRTGRETTPLVRWRIGRRAARRFEISETRRLPLDRLPSRPVALHHFYALLPAGDSYFVVKLSTTRETYLDYREAFERVLDTFRVLGQK